MEWVRKTAVSVMNVITGGITTHRLAMSFAVGLVGGLFPIPFTTTLVCMPLIYLLGANVLIAQLINGLLTPVQPFMIAVFLAIGQLFAPGLWTSEEPVMDIIKKVGEAPLESITHFSYLFLTAVIGWSIAALPLIFMIYFATRPIARRIIEGSRNKNE